MLNLLVDKVLQRSPSKPEPQQPIFTISYSSIKTKIKTCNSRQFQNKTVMNKIPKITKKDNNIFQKWKSKTLEKLKDLQTPQKYSFLPIKTNKNISIKPKHIELSTELNNQTLKDDYNLKQMKTSFIVHKKYAKAKNNSFMEGSNSSPVKSIYLQYKDQTKQKKKKIITLSNFYQKKLIQNHAQKSFEHSQLQKSQNQIKQQDKFNNSNKNVSFFNTIQYKTVPRQEIKHYRFDQFQNSKRSILARAQNSFVRTSKTIPKPEFHINNTIPTMQTIKTSQTRFQQEHPTKESSSKQSISIRKVYTQKRSRKNIKQIIQQNNPQSLRVKFDNYRPWSPIKTNPLVIQQDELLFQQSKTFNIFSNLQQTQQEQY